MENCLIVKQTAPRADVKPCQDGASNILVVGAHASASRTSCSVTFVSYGHTTVVYLCRDSRLPESARRRLGLCVIRAVLQSEVSTLGRA